MAVLVLNLRKAVRGDECLFTPRDSLKRLEIAEAFDGGNVVLIKAEDLKVW